MCHTVFYEVVAIATEVCKLLSHKIVDKVCFIPISAAHSQNLGTNISKNGTNNNDDVMVWYKGPSLLQKLNEISYTTHMPLSKFDNNNSSFTIMRHKSLENTKNLACLPKTQRYQVFGYITSTSNCICYAFQILIILFLEGAIAEGDTLYLQPNFYKVYGKKLNATGERIPLKVLSIQCFDKEQKEALAG